MYHSSRLGPEKYRVLYENWNQDFSFSIQHIFHAITLMQYIKYWSLHKLYKIHLKPYAVVSRSAMYSSWWCIKLDHYNKYRKINIAHKSHHVTGCIMHVHGSAIDHDHICQQDRGRMFHHEWKISEARQRGRSSFIYHLLWKVKLTHTLVCFSLSKNNFNIINSRKIQIIFFL